LSKDAGNQPKDASSKLLTEDVWEQHESVRIKYPCPDVKLCMSKKRKLTDVDQSSTRYSGAGSSSDTIV
jgi:hypothetical protein